MKFLPEKLRKKSEQSPETPNRLEEIAKAIYEKKGEIPKEGEIRAMALIEKLKIPAAPYSSLEWQRTLESKEKDKIIAEYLTNKPGVIEGETENGERYKVVSFDIRDIYPNGLPEELKETLDRKSLNYLEKEYESQEKIIEKYGETKNWLHADCPIHYFRLPGGIDLFLRGYVHNKDWQKIHGTPLKEANKFAQVICIEGFPDIPSGESLGLYWSTPEAQCAGHYNVLMHEAVENGFNGIFTEVDARGAPLVDFDKIVKELPDEFFKKYFGYLKKSFPSLTEEIKSPKNLKELLVLSATKGILKRMEVIFHQGKQYSLFPYVDRKGKTSFEPTGFELGQTLFSDALAAIKLHLIAKLMADGKLEKGPIVDYEGANHLSSKTFFLKYPEYAAEVVLRTIHHLKEGKIKNVPEVYKVFENPNWEEIVREIAKLVFKKPVKIGDRRKLEDVSIDYLKTYGIDPKNVIPSDEEVERIIEKLKKETQIKKEENL